MKRAIIVLLVILVLFCGCDQTSSGKNTTMGKTDKEIIPQAIEELKDYWKDYYLECGVGDGHLEIKNTRVVYIKETDIEEFSDVSCLVEFVLFSDFAGTAPYYYDWGTNNVVIVYKDGSMEVSHNPLLTYRARTYSNDFSDIVDSLEDYEDDYNCVIKDLL